MCSRKDSTYGCLHPRLRTRVFSSSHSAIVATRPTTLRRKRDPIRQPGTVGAARYRLGGGRAVRRRMAAHRLERGRQHRDTHRLPAAMQGAQDSCPCRHGDGDGTRQRIPGRTGSVRSRTGVWGVRWHGFGRYIVANFPDAPTHLCSGEVPIVCRDDYGHGRNRSATARESTRKRWWTERSFRGGVAGPGVS